MQGFALSARLGDIKGGIAATLFALPIELIYGSIAIAPLGAINSSLGIQAALWTCAMGGLLALIFRGTPGIINGSSTDVAFIVSALTAKLIHLPQIVMNGHSLNIVFILIFLCTAMAGAIQCVFALARIGRVLRFIPYPVVAGIQVGAAALMVKDAAMTTAGVTDFSWSQLLAGAWHPLSLVVVAVTLLLALRPPRLLQQAPVMLVALVGGLLTHYAFLLIFGAGNLGGSWSQINGLILPMSLWDYGNEFPWSSLWQWIPVLLPYSLAIATVASMESLHSLTPIEAATGSKPSAERELWVQGTINLAAGLFGGLPSVANAARSSANVRAGARTRLSGVVYAIAILLFMAFAGHWFSAIPHAVTAGLILYLASGLIDDGAKRLLSHGISTARPLGRTQFINAIANVSVLVIVAMVTFFGDMLEGTAVGMVAAMILFIRSSMTPIVRNMVSAQHRRSLKVRSVEATRLLESGGQSIHIMELEGVLFFGTAERLNSEIGKLPVGVKTVILDFTKVRNIDATAARTLLQLTRKCLGRGQLLYVCGASQAVDAEFVACGIKDLIAPQYWFFDSDHALEAAEEALLASVGAADSKVDLELEQTTLARGLTPEEIVVLERFTLKHDVAGSTALFRQADPGSSLFVAASGVIDIFLPLRNGTKKRIACFAPGIIVGEMSFLDRSARSAEGFVESPGLVWELTRDAFDSMSEQFPAIANKLMINVSLGLSSRLRLTTQSLRAASLTEDANARGPLLAGQVERRRNAR